MYDKYGAKCSWQGLKTSLHVSYSCRNVFFNPLEVFILKTEHKQGNYCSISESQSMYKEEMQPNDEPTSLLSSFWEPLESGFEPLIFIPSVEQSIIGTWL